MRHIVVSVVMTVTFLMMGVVRGEAGDAHASTAPPVLERPAHFKLADASPSIDDLIARLMDALAKNDAAAVDRLRVTETEYRTFFLPGAGDPGQPARVYDDGSSQFAWSKMNTNSTYALAGIMRDYGGHTFAVKEVKYLKGRKDYAWYTAYRTAGLTLEDESGKRGELVLGSIVEVDGQFKFMSLLGNR